MAVRVLDVERVRGAPPDRAARGREPRFPCTQVVHGEREQVAGTRRGAVSGERSLQHQHGVARAQPNRAKTGFAFVAAQDLELQHAGIERERALDVGDAQRDVVDTHAGVGEA